MEQAIPSIFNVILFIVFFVSGGADMGAAGFSFL